MAHRPPTSPSSLRRSHGGAFQAGIAATSASSPTPASALTTSTSSSSHPKSRVTRSATKRTVDHELQPARTSARSSKKRKPSIQLESSPTDEPSQSNPTSAPRRSKRQKTQHDSPGSPSPPKRSSRKKSAVGDTEMSNTGSSSKYTEEPSSKASKSTSRQPSSRSNKKFNQPETSPTVQTPSIRRQKKRLTKKNPDLAVKSEDDGNANKDDTTSPPLRRDNSDSIDSGSPNGGDDDPFSAAIFGSGRGAPAGLSSTLRALSGMMSGMSSRLREILANLRQVDNPTMQLVALEELSNLLLVSNEDNLSGQFSPDPYIKELVALMQPNQMTGEENPEMMLLSCRCIANLMEALRGSVANVVYGGAVPILCQKLLDIQYIDVAEQALSTLSKISVDFPASIVREGGLTACLQFLDFFATGTQRTAVTTAANCCRNIPHDSFPVIKDVMPILQNVLSSHDQKVVEQGCLCVTRVIDSFKHAADRLEQLIEPALLRAVLGLLLPGTTNLIGANIHTEFLRVLAIVARASPTLSAELLKMNVVDTLYQILTGVSPPDETSNAASKIDSVVIMQALIHRPRDQVYETLNVICELLPRPKIMLDLDYEIFERFDDSISDLECPASQRKSRISKRLELLDGCKDQTRRFAMILMPTLTDAYSSTVNLSVRQKVLTAQLKILSNLDTSVVEEVLRPVPYASFLASILSQEDHPSLVMFALQASELLFDRLEDIYQYQFHREGVIGEISKIADRTSQLDSRILAKNSKKMQPAGEISRAASSEQEKDAVDDVDQEGQDDASKDDDDDDSDEDHDDEDDRNEDDDDDENVDPPEEEEVVVRDPALDDSDGSDSSDEDVPSPVAIAGIGDLVIMRAKTFLEKYETSKGQELRARAAGIRDDLHKLANDIEASYTSGEATKNGLRLFQDLAKYFDGDALQSITSSELLDSGIIRVLVLVLATNSDNVAANSRGDFLAAFMGTTDISKVKTAIAATSSTAFSVLVQKLQDLLSRAEHFEVLTVNNNALDSGRSSSTSMLSRQLRLRLTAESETDIPPTYREMIVSIHAIATFKALDDYLRPRFSLSAGDRSGSMARRHEMLQQLAHARMAQLSGAADSGLFSPFGHDLNSPTASGAMATGRAAPHPPSQPKEKSERRRSRRHQTSSTAEIAPPPPPRPEPSTDAAESSLEIADEKALEDPELGDDALEAFVEGLDDEMSDDDMPEPPAVDMEIASTGKVTARREDGTRIVTPQPGTPVPGAARADSAVGSQRSSSRNIQGAGRPSYAAALRSVPQDWHIEFSLDDNVIPHHTTIYRAVHHNRDANASSPRSIWSGVHAVKFKKVKGPPPSETTLSAAAEAKAERDDKMLPVSLDGHPVTSAILSLLRLLHELNASLDDVRETLGRTGLRLYSEPLASFINTKLTAKMNRQLEEPLIVASNCLPDWAEDLARSFPFLFPFETRHLFLQSTSFGYSRSMIRWQSNQNDNDDRRDRRRDDRPLMGRPQRQKVRISRSRILESAMKVMDMYGASPSVLEVEYFEEVGTGLGPTLEFYSTVSKEFSKKKLKMWRENDLMTEDEYAVGKGGLFPAPISDADASAESGKKLLALFRILGKFVARSMLDSRIIDISFSTAFFRVTTNKVPSLSIGLLRTIDADLANSLAQLQLFANAAANIDSETAMSTSLKASALSELTIKGARLEDLALDFTLPGYEIDLLPGGSEIPVTMTNVQEYIDLVLDKTLNSGVRKQIDAFQNGFSQVFAYTSLRAFTPAELVMLFGRVEEDWTIETLMDSVKADHGFNMDSKSVKNLLQTMSELSKEQRRDFLQFVTGSPKLPIGGFKSLTPMFTVVCKPSEPPYNSDDYLPSVMTCVNYLKLPDYSNQDVLKERLGVAIKEGQGAFHLS